MFKKVGLNKGLYTWSDLHTCANFAYMQNLHTYANRSMCTHLLTYAKFARMQKLENLHLPQTKCKSHFAYMQILHICKSGHVNAHVSIYLIVLNNLEMTLFQDCNYLVNNLN